MSSFETRPPKCEWLLRFIGQQPIPDEIRAHAFVALGKLCLSNYDLAKQYITVFVRELQSTTSPVAVRNNLLFILSDLCVR